MKVIARAKVSSSQVAGYGLHQIEEDVSEHLFALAHSQGVHVEKMTTNVRLTKKDNLRVEVEGYVLGPVYLSDESVARLIEDSLIDLADQEGIDTTKVKIKVFVDHSDDEVPFGARGIYEDLQAAYGGSAADDFDAEDTYVGGEKESDTEATESTVGWSDFHTRLEALDRALRVSVESGADAVVETANKFLDFLFGKKGD